MNSNVESVTKDNLEPLTAICQSNSANIYQRLTKHAVSYSINAINAINNVLEQARTVADNSKRHDYINAMGGVFVTRKDRPLKLAYDNAVNTETGEIKLDNYDSHFIKTIKGVVYQEQMIVTRFFSWRLERANAVCFNLEFCK